LSDFKKVEKVPEIDQKVKGLTLTFGDFLWLFFTFAVQEMT
jgi:hypothetical protein